MSLSKLRSAVEQADSLQTRIDQLTRVRALIAGEHDARVAPGQVPLEVAYLSAASARAAITADIDRLTTRLNALLDKINQAGANL